MNTVEQASLDLPPEQDASTATADQDTSPVTSDQSLSPDDHDEMSLTPPKISGYDGGTHSILKEPSLYLSIAVVFIATSVCLSKTPTMFWLSVLAMSAVAIVFHLLAERFLFRTNQEYKFFKAPFEGVFVVTFGSIIPGACLLAYGIYALTTAVRPNPFEVLGKLALLLIVPIFNFAVWSGVRRGYLIRPRYIGLMNGFALGLSSSWTIIWVKTMIAHGDTSCKFGWMLLLCTAPFLLFAAGCLSHDLWHKTETNIRRITTTFSVLGCALSFLFVFTPMTRTFVVQSQLNSARSGSPADQEKAISAIRSMATDEDLRPLKYPVTGFALAALMIPNRGLDGNNETDRNLFFKITGKSFFDSDSKKEKTLEAAQTAISPLVGGMAPGLALLKSQITGNIDATTFSSAVDWTLTFHNSNSGIQEARGEIGLPKNAAVSRVTLWIDGEPREAAFASNSKVQAAYQSETSQRRDPLLVTMSAPDRVLFQCFPVPANGGEMKIRLGFKLPLETTDGKICSLELPKLVSSNFTQPKRHRVNITSRDVPVKNIAGVVAKATNDGYSLSGIIKPGDKSKTISSVVVQRSSALTELATQDWYSKEPRFIIERVREITAPAPKHLTVVVDTSALLKRNASQLKQALSIIPSKLKPMIYFAGEDNNEKVPDSDKVANAAHESASAKEPDAKNNSVEAQAIADEQETDAALESDGIGENNNSESETAHEVAPTAKSLEQALTALNANLFVGGQDNGPALREALEVAAEQPNSAVLWIHGPQPLTQRPQESTALDLVNRVSLYDLQIVPGPNTILPALQVEDVSNQITHVAINHGSTANDLKKLVSGWEKGIKTLAILKTISTKRPQTAIVTDRSISAQVTALWASEEVARLVANGQEQQAIKLASNYRLVSPVSGSVVLENSRQYKANKLDPGEYKGGLPYGAPSGGSGLVGAPVDPRYGQSNEVGQLADFGYDTARDIVRIVTLLSSLISLIIAITFLRGQKSLTRLVIAKAAVLVLVVPTMIHMIGTFAINNFGGLGGGL